MMTGLPFTAAMATFSSDLVGLLAADVEAAIGRPTKVDGARWTYVVNGVDAFYLYVKDGNRIGSVRTDDFRLSILKKK
jgi:hypothetical protein